MMMMRMMMMRGGRGGGVKNFNEEDHKGGLYKMCLRAFIKMKSAKYINFLYVLFENLFGLRFKELKSGNKVTFVTAQKQPILPNIFSM